MKIEHIACDAGAGARCGKTIKTNTKQNTHYSPKKCIENLLHFARVFFSFVRYRGSNKK